MKKVSRARRGGGTVVPLATPATSQGIMGPEGEWFGPGRPMVPIAPRSVVGRRYDYMHGQNMQTTPRWGTQNSFPMLRALADGHDLTRLAIETRKDQMARLQFSFRLIDSEDDMTPDQEERVKRYRTLLRRPDGENFWADWLRMVLEDLLVIDAPTIFVRRTMDESEIVGLCQIDGATIKPVIDAHGRTPEYPQAAYQQILHGMPAVDYTTRQLVYRPRNRRVHTVYGFSPVEQILATINIALRRQIWQHAYFTNGNLPDSLIGVPSTWSPDQIRDFQDWFDALLQGNTEKRRGALFVPGEVAKSYVPTKDAEMFGAAEEWLARVVCYCFGISHQALVREVNRATAETAADQALADGLAPIMGWVKSLMDGMLIDQFGESEIEFIWADETKEDPVAQDALWKGRVDAGAATRNEWRTATGLEPREEPEADMLMVAGQVAPLSVQGQIDQQKVRAESGLSSESGGSEGEDDPEAEPSGSSESGEEEAAEKSIVPFAVAEAGAEKAVTPHRIETLTQDQIRAFRALSPERPFVERERLALQRILERGLRRAGGRVAAAVRTALEGTVSKADTSTPDPEPIIDAALAAFAGLDFIIDATSDVLEEIARDATRQVISVLGASSPDDLFDQVSPRSVAIAEARAAELVGRRVLEDGSIIDNPNARWAITEATRTMIRDDITRVLRDNEGSDAIIRALEQTHTFSPARAEMVSRTEVADINSRAQMETYRGAEEAGVDVEKEWILGPAPCEICQANADQGPIPLDEDFDSGDDTAPAHPNCVCAVIPVVRTE